MQPHAMLLHTASAAMRVVLFIHPSSSAYGLEFPWCAMSILYFNSLNYLPDRYALRQLCDFYGVVIGTPSGEPLCPVCGLIVVLSHRSAPPTGKSAVPKPVDTLHSRLSNF